MFHDKSCLSDIFLRCLTFVSAAQEAKSSCRPHGAVLSSDCSGLWFLRFLQKSHTLSNPLPGFLLLWEKITPAAVGGKRKCHWACFLLCDLCVQVRGAAGNTFHYEITAQHHTGKVKGRLLKASFTFCKFSLRESMQQ